MKKFFRKRLIVIIAIAVALALCISVAAYVRGHSGNLVSDGVNGAMDPLESSVASVAGWLENIYGYMYKQDSLEAENAELRVQIAALEEQARQSGDALEENQRLRDLLGLQERHKDFTFESATVVSWGSSNWSSTFTISKGRNDGLELYDCVITENGCLAGQIIELSTSSAVVRTVIDPDASIGAMVDRSGSAAVAGGDFELMTHGCFKLSYLPEGSQLLTGDTILTAGSGTFPSGLVLGQVVTVEADAGGISDHAVVEPAADLYSLTQVFVITDFSISD